MIGFPSPLLLPYSLIVLPPFTARREIPEADKTASERSHTSSFFPRVDLSAAAAAVHTVGLMIESVYRPSSIWARGRRGGLDQRVSTSSYFSPLLMP